MLHKVVCKLWGLVRIVFYHEVADENIFKFKGEGLWKFSSQEHMQELTSQSDAISCNIAD